MSERYSRLFTLPENLYAVGSPVVIVAGALLKDNQNGKIVAQLKLRNISNKVIKAVKVSLNLFDTAGKPIGNVVEYEYLDLDASRDTEFGQKNPVFVTESKARSYKAAVTEVVFADKTTWTASDAEWEPLPRQKTLDAVLQDSELVKQYRIAVGSNFSYYPAEEKDLWYCACGALNHESENCHTCNRTLFELQTIDLDQLVRDKDTRLAQEAREAAEENAAREATAIAAKKKTARILKILIPIACIVVAFVVLLNSVIIPNGKYNKAISLMEAGQYEDAIAAFEAMNGYKDSTEQIVLCENAIVAAEQARIEAEKATQYAEAETFADSGELGKAAIAFAKLGNYRGAHNKSVDLRNSYHKSRFSILAEGYNHVVTINADGTLWYKGDNEHGQCNVADWKNIVSIHAGIFHTVGLTSDGTAVATGYQEDGRCNVSDWTNVFDLDAGYYHTAALFMDGTVEVVGKNKYGEGNVSEWNDIIAVSAGGYHTVGLKSDGTVVATGYNEYGQCDVSNWSDIVAIGAGELQTIGLKSDGTVVATGYSDDGRCDVSDWTDIATIYAGNLHTVGLKADGSVMVAGYNKYGECDISDWKDMSAICAGWYQTVGLKSDDTVVAAGTDNYGACNANGWTHLIDN